MRFVWTVLKVLVGLAIAIPLCIIGFAITGAALGLLIGLATMVAKLAALVLGAYVAFKVLARLIRGPKARPQRLPSQLGAPAPDPHYEAAMRELNMELGHTR